MKEIQTGFVGRLEIFNNYGVYLIGWWGYVCISEEEPPTHLEKCVCLPARAATKHVLFEILAARSSYELNAWNLNALLYKWIYKVSLQNRSNSDASNHDFWNDMVVFLYMIVAHFKATPLGTILAVLEAICALNGSIGRQALFHKAFWMHFFIRDTLPGALEGPGFVPKSIKVAIGSINIAEQMQLHPKPSARHTLWQYSNDFEVCFHSKT